MRSVSDSSALEVQENGKTASIRKAAVYKGGLAAYYKFGVNKDG